jgi:hypothetical protein
MTCLCRCLCIYIYIYIFIYLFIYITFEVRLISVIYVPDDDEYFTAPSTPVKLSSSESLICCEDTDSDDGDANMSTPEEGPDVFIKG